MTCAAMYAAIPLTGWQQSNYSSLIPSGSPEGFGVCYARIDQNGTVVNANGQAKQDLLIESGIVRQLGNNISAAAPV